MTSAENRSVIGSIFSIGRNDLIDAGFLFCLGALAILGFRTTYAGSYYLFVGAAGLLFGLLIAHVANALRQPAIVVAAMAVAVFFLLGAALAARAQAAAGVFPTVGSTRDLASVSVHGWKQLLTTLPPVDSRGPLLTIPYILGLIGGAAGLAIASRRRSAILPVLAPGLMLAAVILLGTSKPAAQLMQGVVFGIIALGWMAMRGLRLRPPLQNGVGLRARALTAAALVTTASIGAAFVGPHLPGLGSKRVVLRSFVVPPFDINQFPSPLVGFRKYTKSANMLWDQTLFTVSGVPKGDYVRIATLDYYDGSVWGATNGTLATRAGEPPDAFQRVGSSIATDASGEPLTLRVKVAQAYAESNDLSAWLPTTGTVTRVEFAGTNRSTHKERFVYNRATEQGIVPDRLHAGDVYVLHTIAGGSEHAQSVPLPNAAQPFGSPTLPASAFSFTSPQATQWSAGASGVVPKVSAVARHLVDQGAFSDGGDQSPYLPGHSLFRLSTDFLNDHQPVGDDEQYAAAFALLANQLGLPARVVLGAEPEARGVVQGRDVHTWVEVRLSPGTWVSVPRSVFMPPTSKLPEKKLPQTVQSAKASIVPPPNPLEPHSALDQAAEDPPANHPVIARTRSGWHLPGFVIAAIKVVLPPVAVIGSFVLLVIGLKARRRRRRRTTGPFVTRVAHGWNEIVDHVRDFGVVLPAGHTRREEARLLETFTLHALASAADATVFGAGEPGPEQAEAYWREVDLARKAINNNATRWQRWRAALSLRSFRSRPSQARPSTA